MRESENTIGDERLALAKAKVLAQEFEAEQRGADRRAIVVRLVELTAMLPNDLGLRMQMLFLRGRAALELDDPELGRSIAKELRALSASATADDAGLEILARLDLKGWNTDESPTWYEVVAREVDAAVVTDPDGRARMAATRLPWKVRDKQTGIVMLLCPPGEFVMGSPASEADRFSDELQHRRTIRTAFYLSETQVTQEQWRNVMGSNPSTERGSANPVEGVSWNDCQQFCAATGLRLPSEAEWEYACRAGTSGAIAGDVGPTAWIRAKGGQATQPVATKAANPWGLHDMHGSIWEWCQDAFGQYSVQGGTEEASTGGSSYRVLRGGSWYDAGYFRPASRYSNAPDFTGALNGFRVARAPL